MGELERMVRRLDERTVEISLPNRMGYERIAMDCSASFASNRAGHILDKTACRSGGIQCHDQRWSCGKNGDQADKLAPHRSAMGVKGGNCP
jgi:hypothetical protein